MVSRDLYTLIPTLISGYKDNLPRNDLYLTTMIELMQDAKYPDWENSDLAKEFSDAYWATVDLNEVNADKVIYYAKEFVASRL